MKNPSNDRLADHPSAPSQYGAHVSTKVDGSYEKHSIDPNNRHRIFGFFTALGNFVSHLIEGDGHVNHGTEAGHKEFSGSKTSTTTGHRDTGTGGGESNNTKNGGQSQNGTDTSHAGDGNHHDSKSGSHKQYTKGGDGHHSMAGDQSFVVEEGGIHYNVASNYTITAQKSIQLDSTGEQSYHVGGNWGVTALNGTMSQIASGTINISSDTSITLACGSSSITITPDSITIQASAINFNKS